MYRLGKRIETHRKRFVIVVIVVMLLLGMVAAGVVVVKSLMKPNTVIGKTPTPVITKVVDNRPADKVFNETLFLMSLPGDWRFVSHVAQPHNTYTWHNTASNPGSRVMAVYVDTIPPQLGVNRVLPVQSEGNRLIPTTVSDNCANFTGKAVPGPTNSPAKWEGINFLCDLGNYVRDVVGTSSSDGVNRVTLTGKTAGKHQLFFTYTDNTSSPDYTIFTNALQSFRLR